MNNNYKLYNEDFLIALSEQQNREIYARITSLDIDELPQDYIEGKITTGSINIDGNSSVRRTCNLTMVSNNKELKDFYWGIKTKFQLEIGLRNRLYGEYQAVKDGDYPDIVWFPQGIYLIATFNTSISTNSLTVSISGKDKMSLLNGDFGGQLFASINFGEEEIVETGVEEAFFNSAPENSKELINKNYYIKLTENDFNTVNDSHQDFNPNLFSKNDFNKIEANDPNFKFYLEENNDGLYYKKDNVYIKDFPPRSESSYKHYNIFVKIEKLLKDKESLVFEEVPNVVNWNYGEIRNNYLKYYYKDSDGQYIKNEENSIYDSKKTYYIQEEENNIIKYTPINIYKRNFYYSKPILEQPYYSLQSSWYAKKMEDISNLDNNRTYYKLKTLYEAYENVKKRQVPIREIIKEAVHAYAKEPYQNIIIKDLDEYGLEQLTYKGDVPLYALYDTRVGQFTQILILSDTDAAKKFRPEENEEGVSKPFQFMTLNTFMNDLKSFSDYIPKESNITYKVMKIKYGQDVGYRLTDLTYAGELISKPGETLTSVFDKIKQMLGNFEYFYDLNGRFVFQKKPNYIQTTFSQIVKNEDESYINYGNSNSKFSFNFEGNKLISSFQNNPTLNNVTNDYSIWGKRKTLSGAEKKIHLRYAIDKKPVYYKNLKNEIYITKEYQGEKTNEMKNVDWRELIYQMALDYFAGQGWSEENPFTSENNQQITSPDYFLYEVGRRNLDYYPSGYTGYEQYYTDLQGFWRELYNPNPEPKPLYTNPSYKLINTKRYEWIEPVLYDYEVQYYFHKDNLDENDLLKKKYDDYNIPENSEKFGWNINVFDHPETLDFWFDFLESDFELAQFSVPQLGPRSKVSEESDVSAIDYGQVPDLIFYTATTKKNVSYKDKDGIEYTKEVAVCDEAKLAHEINENTGYTFIYLPTGYSQFFDISSRKASLKDKLDELLYQNSYCIENITITAIPIYYLEPNTRIFVQDKETNIEGEYIINRLTIPLNYNGTMSITANKAPQRIY